MRAGALAFLRWSSAAPAVALGRSLGETPDQIIHLAGDELFNRFGERARLPVGDHGAATFVAALLQNAQGRNVGEDIVGVACHPYVVPAVLLLEAKRIVHHDLAA